MDIEQRIAELEVEVAWLMAQSTDQYEGESDEYRRAYLTSTNALEGPKLKVRLNTALEGQRLKVRHEMAKGLAELVADVGISIDDLCKYGGIAKRTWQDLLICAESEFDYQMLAVGKQSSDDKYRSGISNLSTSMKGFFVLREAIRSLPIRNFSEEEFNKRKKAYKSCEEILEGTSDKCDGQYLEKYWRSSYRFAKLFAQEQGYLGA